MSKRCLISVLILAFTSCALIEAPPRDNPNDPKSKPTSNPTNSVVNVVTNGLVSWWKFNGNLQDSGSLANPMSGCTDSYVTDRKGNLNSALSISGGSCRGRSLRAKPQLKKQL
ncbi:MAG: hypothetical protein D6767_03500 [Candidatus Hydrogenedentota bacterium]|nr:MAG: hypothetical protein D6767_03500 [Candidatus Hydrogenedentota bacterium]